MLMCLQLPNARVHAVTVVVHLSVRPVGDRSGQEAIATADVGDVKGLGESRGENGVEMRPGRLSLDVDERRRVLERDGEYAASVPP